MAGGYQKEVPWCSLFLVIGAVICHTMVLMGNYKTASALQVLGQSSGGWSRVGLGLSKALQIELDDKMDELSGKLLDGLSEIPKVQLVLDQVLSMLGVAVDEANTTHVPNTSLLLLQTDEGFTFTRVDANGSHQHRKDKSDGDKPGLAPLVAAGVEDLVKQAVHQIVEVVFQMWDKLKPALEKVGEWIIKFGHAIQDAVETFSSSIDKVQKLFDQMMGQMNGPGGNIALMLEQTFNLFDVSGTGTVTEDDLVSVARLYSISALSGKKPGALVEKYDGDASGDLSPEEFELFVQDESVPKIMAVVLRTYARRLAEVGGKVGAARRRDEVALSLVNYLELVCAKNMTKVGWVADTLGNGSLPTEFTADVMAQMCLTSERPGKLSDKDVGATVIGEMHRMHPQHTVESANLMSDPEFWMSEGFNPDDQPKCVEKVTGWVSSAEAALLATFLQSSVVSDDIEVLNAMPAAARNLSLFRVMDHQAQRMAALKNRRASLYRTATAQKLLDELLGGVPATDGATADTPAGSPAQRALAGGQPAKPETLQFARWLANNATTNAGIFQNYCFEYASESSTTTETVATQILAMVKKTQSFIKMMMKYATPKGIEQLEDTMKNFMTFGEKEVLRIVMSKADPLIENTVPVVENAARQAAHDVGENIGHTISEQLALPIAKAIEDQLGKLANSSIPNPAAAKAVEVAGAKMGEKVGEMTEGVIGDAVGNLLEGLVDKAIDTASDKLEDKLEKPDDVALAEKTPAHATLMEEDDMSGQFEQLAVTLRALTNLLPAAVSTLKTAREEVSKAAKSMHSVFETFELKGPDIFNQVASYYRIVWTLYWGFFCPMTLLLLWYAFWASGWCGGPQPIAIEDSEPPSTMRERMCSVFSCCCTCLTRFHDTQLCFWSVMVLMQLVVLVIFAVSILLCILAGLKAFVISGCGQVYLLNDGKVCGALLENLRAWLDNFHLHVPGEDLEPLCTKEGLMTCRLLTSELGSSAILTTTFSILATILSLQMLMDSAMLHEMARYRRLFLANESKAEKADAPAAQAPRRK